MILIEILIPICGMALTFGIVYLAITASNREKMAMIEKGMDPIKSKRQSHSKLRFAMLAIFVPIGILVGHTCADMIDMRSKMAALIFAFLFGGIGLIITHLIENKGNGNSEFDQV